MGIDKAARTTIVTATRLTASEATGAVQTLLAHTCFRMTRVRASGERFWALMLSLAVFGPENGSKRKSNERQRNGQRRVYVLRSVILDQMPSKNASDTILSCPNVAVASFLSVVCQSGCKLTARYSKPTPIL